MPSLEHYRSQMGATNRIRLVKNARPTSENVGDALTAAGEVLARVERARAESELADLDTEAKRQMDALYRSLEQDGEGNYGDFEKRLTEGSQQIRSDLSKKARSGFARKALDTRFDDIETSYIVKTRNLQAQRGAEEMKAGVIADMAILEDIAKDTSVLFDDPKNPQARTFKSERASVEAKINSLQRGGFIGKDGAAEMKVRLDNLSEGALSYRHQKEISARLDNGQYAQADEYLKMHYGELTPEARDQAEAAVEKMKDEGQAYEKADQFWAASEGNPDQYGAAMDEARKIKDPTLRAKIESRLTTRKEQENQADAVQQREVYSQGLGALQSGGRIPSEVFMAARPETRDLWADWQYQQEQRANARREMSAAERAAAKQMSEVGRDSLKAYASLDPEIYMDGPMSWTDEMKDYWDDLLPEHQSEVMADIAKRKERGGTMDAADDVFKQVIAQVPMLGPQNMKGKDFDKGSSGKGAARVFTDEEKAVRASLLRQSQQQAARTGGAPLTAQETKLMIARAFHEANAKRYPAPRFGQFSGELREAITSAGGYNQYDETRKFLKEKLGRDPTSDEVRQALSDLEAGGDQ